MRVYIVVKHHKHEENKIIMSVWLDKHKAKERALEHDEAHARYQNGKKAEDWCTIEKYDVVDTENIPT